MQKKIGCLSQGWKVHGGTDKIKLITHKDKPKDRRATYVRAICDIRPQKIETHITRLTAGGNLIDYPGEVSTPTSDLDTMKLHVNSTISDVTSRYMCMDVNDLYLNNQMDRDKYIIIQISMISQEFVEKYNLAEKAHNGYIYARVKKVMYGLPQAGQIAHAALINT